MICEVIVLVNQNRQVHVLRELQLQKTDVDVPEVTTWSPIDLGDVDSDGHLEVVLEGDAYENHWFEVVRIHDGVFQDNLHRAGLLPVTQRTLAGGLAT